MDNRCLITKEYVNNIIRKRPQDIHKGQCGRVLIIAGSRAMTGAAVLCAKGAFRAGAGLVYVSIPEEVFPVVQISVPEAICVLRSPETDFGIYDAVAVGPGIGVDAENTQIIRKILKEYKKTVVIDADGLNTVAAADLFEDMRTSSADIVITPHMGEAARLLDIMPAGREEIAEKLSELTGATAVLKGAGTIVASAGEKSYTNTTGNPGMATAGSGDTLTGIIASLAAQGYSGFEAAACGVYIHGLAGDMAADAIGQWGITASDIAEYASRAIKDIISQ